MSNKPQSGRLAKRRIRGGMLQASTNSSMDMKNALLGMGIMSKSNYNLDNKVFFWFEVHLLNFLWRTDH